MKSWNVRGLELKPRLPEIISSSEDARVIVLDLATGESLDEHEVHERAFLIVLSGEVEVGTGAGASAAGGAGLLVEFKMDAPAPRLHRQSRFRPAIQSSATVAAAGRPTGFPSTRRSNLRDTGSAADCAPNPDEPDTSSACKGSNTPRKRFPPGE